MFCGCLNIKKRQICSDDNLSYGDGKISNSSNHKSEYVNRSTPNSKQNNMTQSSSRGFFSFARRRKKTRKGGSKEELRMSKPLSSSLIKGRKTGQKKENAVSCRVDEPDDELDTDGYSKLEGEDIHFRERYDYPTFLRNGNGGGGTDEHLYASASQTYSFWSEDPYSSIKSVMGDRASGVKGDESSIYEPGYSKIRKIPVQQKTKSLNVDEPKSSHDLYPKIIHNQRSRKDFKPNNLPSTSVEASNNNLDNSQKFSVDGKSLLDNQQDSASGSLTSGSQPSYRYLTVRESPRIVRERIRRREEAAAAAALLAENNENSDRNIGERRPEHYYSEINEYESVGGGSLYNRPNSTEQLNEVNGHLTTSPPNQNNQFNKNLGTSEMLCIDSGLNSSTEPPHPPTSPIPKTLPTTSCSSSTEPPQSLISKPSIRRPVVLRMAPPKPLSTLTEEHSKKLPSNGILSSNNEFSKHIRAVLQPIWSNGGSFIGEKKQQKGGETSGQSSLTTSTRASLVEVNTQTAPIPPSRIPVPLNGMLTKQNYNITRRTPSPTRDVSVQTTGSKAEQKGLKAVKKNVKKLPLPPLPGQVGKDYVSPIDLGNERAWPLKTINQTDEGG
uniref:Uncharacterized protein n=1 Tax=Meloidogyne enterolobii TaxID=390850 RepID=A0A6V7VD60_MELEN|nr:unnamed protein product [Meloidogyne enterolobii]